MSAVFEWLTILTKNIDDDGAKVDGRKSERKGVANLSLEGQPDGACSMGGRQGQGLPESRKGLPYSQVRGNGLPTHTLLRSPA